MEKENVSTALLEELIKNRQVAKLRELFETIPTIDLAEAANDSKIFAIFFIFKVVSDYTANSSPILIRSQEKVIHLFTIANSSLFSTLFTPTISSISGGDAGSRLV